MGYTIGHRLIDNAYGLWSMVYGLAYGHWPNGTIELNQFNWPGGETDLEG